MRVRTKAEYRDKLKRRVRRQRRSLSRVKCDTANCGVVGLQALADATYGGKAQSK